MKRGLRLVAIVGRSHGNRAASGTESTPRCKQTQDSASRRSSNGTGYAGENRDVQSAPPLVREPRENTALGSDRKGHLSRFFFIPEYCVGMPACLSGLWLLVA